MSLTSILKDPNGKELRDKLKLEFLRPKFNVKSIITVSPLTKNYGTIGTAFDYLMRFQIEYINKGKGTIKKWIADIAIEELREILCNYPIISTGRARIELNGTINQGEIKKSSDILDVLETQYSLAKMNYKKFIESGKLTNELARDCIFLAKLDVFYRIGYIDPDFEDYNSDDVEDLMSLVSVMPEENFLAKQKYYLNPSFGEGSHLVRGADADLILDDTLIDIKVTKELKLTREHLNQIIMYYILSLIGGINDNPSDKPIKKVGLYFARQSELWTIPIEELGNQKKFDDFKHWFESYLATKN